MPDWIEVILRTLITVVVLLILTRLIGKRQLSQLSLFEYITGITIGSIAAYVSLEFDAKWYLGIVALVVWTAVAIGIEYLQITGKTLRSWLDGQATVLIKDGKILEDNLKKERITTDELLEQLRMKNVFKAADVEFAIMETNGEINVLLKKESQPITPKHLGVKVSSEQAPQAVIMDGQILDEPLTVLGLNRKWIHTELEKLGVAQENVFLGQVDAYGQLYVDLYDDQIKVPEPQEKAQLLATLKKCEADLEMFGLSTGNAEIKAMYEMGSKKLQQVIEDVKPFLSR